MEWEWEGARTDLCMGIGCWEIGGVLNIQVELQITSAVVNKGQIGGFSTMVCKLYQGCRPYDFR